MIELLDLRTFMIVARSGSFAAASRHLSLSPAMVGRRIQLLEERYGAKLIERTTRAQKLTEIGARFLAKANEILAAVDELEELRGLGSAEISGRVRVTAPTTLGIQRLSALFAEFTKDHPALAIELNLNDRNADLINDGFDLAIRIGDLSSSQMVARRIGTFNFVCCAAPSYVDLHGTPQTPEDLGRARCVLNLNLVPRNRWPFVDADGKRVTLEVQGHLEIDNDQALRSAALAGAGIIYAPHDLVMEDIERGRLVRVLGGWRTMSMPIHTLYPSRDLVPRRVTAIVDYLGHQLRSSI